MREAILVDSPKRISTEDDLTATRDFGDFVVKSVAASNLFALDEYRRRSVAKKGLSPSASIHQVFYIGLKRNCRGSVVDSCQCGISFRFLFTKDDSLRREASPYKRIMANTIRSNARTAKCKDK